MDALARRYLDLWQQSISQAAADPDAARAMAAFFAQFNAFMPPSAAGADRSAADDGLVGALTRIEQRLDRIEARLAALEKPKPAQRAKTRSGKARA